MRVTMRLRMSRPACGARARWLFCSPCSLRLNGLLDGGIEEPCRSSPTRLTYVSPPSAQRLAYVFGQEHRIASGRRGFTQSLQNGHRIANRDALTQQIL